MRARRLHNIQKSMLLNKVILSSSCHLIKIHRCTGCAILSMHVPTKLTRSFLLTQRRIVYEHIFIKSCIFPRICFGLGQHAGLVEFRTQPRNNKGESCRSCNFLIWTPNYVGVLYMFLNVSSYYLGLFLDPNITGKHLAAAACYIAAAASRR